MEPLVATYRALAVRWAQADPERAERFARLATQLDAINPFTAFPMPTTLTLHADPPTD